MTTELIEIPDTPSPKAAWLKRHRLRTRKEDLPRWNSGPRNQEPWVCENAGGTYRGTGTTEHDACLDYAARYGVKHWTVEEWEQDLEELT